MIDDSVLARCTRGALASFLQARECNYAIRNAMTLRFCNIER